MLIKAYFRPETMEETLKTFQGLPDRLRPDRFSEEEDVKNAKSKIADQIQFQTFVSKNEYGFFLFSDRVRYDIVLRPKHGFSSVVAEPLGNRLAESDVLVILKAIAAAGSSFAFAASSDEHDHRNRYVRRLGPDQFEAWIGRDLQKYLPGVYWITVLSKENSDVLPALMRDLGTMVTQIDPEHWLVKTFENSDDWQQHASRLDRWLAEQPEFFSKQRVQAQLDAAPHIGALSELAAQWR